MYIRLVDEHNFKSPVLRIHADEDEFMEQIEEWKQGLLAWVKEPLVNGLPLGRLEAGTCMVDLMRHLTEYYVKTIDGDFAKGYCAGRVFGTLKLMENKYPDIGLDEEVIEIETWR